MKKTTKKYPNHFKNPHTVGIAVVIFIVVTVITYALLQVNNIVPEPTVAPPPMNPAQANTVPVDTSLSLQKSNASVVVMIDTGVDNVSGVQLAISYDPKVLTNVTITPGTFFTNPIELQNTVDAAKGTIDYALAIQPNQTTARGQGAVATISYQMVPGATGSTKLSFRPETKVTSLGANISVLKSTSPIYLP